MRKYSVHYNYFTMLEALWTPGFVAFVLNSESQSTVTVLTSHKLETESFIT